MDGDATAREVVTDLNLREFVGYTMKRAFNTIRSDVNETLRPHGLRMVTYSALSVIVENPGLRQGNIADALSIERPNLVVLVDELERAELIRRGKADHDRRAYALTPTAKGLHVLAEATRALRAHDARMTAGLSDAERAALHSMLHRVEMARENGT